jgi:hypothetical protein
MDMHVEIGEIRRAINSIKEMGWHVFISFDLSGVSFSVSIILSKKGVLIKFPSVLASVMPSGPSLFFCKAAVHQL